MNNKKNDEEIKQQKENTLQQCETEAAKILCTMCGQPFTDWDMNLGDNIYDIFVGYGSKHDCERIKLNLCCDCFDKVLDMIIPMCKINPIVDEDYMSHEP